MLAQSPLTFLTVAASVLLAACGPNVLTVGSGSGSSSATGSSAGSGAGTSTTTGSSAGSGAGTSTTTGNGAGSGAGGSSTTGSDGWVDRTHGTDAAMQLWTAVASDASGDRLVATSTLVIPPGSYISGAWVSTDAGLTWAVEGNGPVGLSTVASNASGTVLVAAEGDDVSGGYIWRSSGGSAPFTTTASPSAFNGWGSVASDASGNHLVAAAAFGDVWTSTDLGMTWADQTPSGPAHGQNWVSMASSTNGTKLVAVAGGGNDVAGPGSTGDIWTSADGGATWTDQTPSGPAHDLYWASVASDATGNNLIAVGAGIWTSVDAGSTWTHRAAPVTGNWGSVASDASGMRVVATSGQFSAAGDIWTSVDGGVTWTNETVGTAAAGQAWAGVASDSTGTHLVGVVRGGDIWTR